MERAVCRRVKGSIVNGGNGRGRRSGRKFCRHDNPLYVCRSGLGDRYRGHLADLISVLGLASITKSEVKEDTCAGGK